jgi:hypothetical protein
MLPKYILPLATSFNADPLGVSANGAKLVSAFINFAAEAKHS